MAQGAPPQIVIVAGPNGAGKTSAAPFLLKDTVGIEVFVNADLIAQGLSGFSPEAVAIQAGKLMITKIRDLVEKRESFAFENTLSGRAGRHMLQRALDAGYHVHVVYLWLPSVELSIARVKRRVESGGHSVPEVDIRRRFARSLRNFYRYYRAAVTTWRVFDASAIREPTLVAFGGNGEDPVVVDTERWRVIQLQAEAGA